MASCAALAELIAWTCGQGPGHCTLPFLLRARVAGSEGWGDSGPGTGQGRRTAGAGVTQHLSCSLAASWEDLARNHFLPHPLPGFCPLASPPQLWGCAQDLQTPLFRLEHPGSRRCRVRGSGPQRRPLCPGGYWGLRASRRHPGLGQGDLGSKEPARSPALLPLELRGGGEGEKGLGRSAQHRVCGVPGGVPGGHSFVLQAVSLPLCACPQITHPFDSLGDNSRLWGAFPFGAVVNSATCTFLLLTLWLGTFQGV